MNSKEYDLAIQCYGRAIELSPEDSFNYSNRALAHIRLKEFSKAIEDSNSAIKLNPNNIKAYHRRGTAYVSTNKLELAIKDFQHILEIEPENKIVIKEIMEVRKKLNDKINDKGKA